MPIDDSPSTPATAETLLWSGHTSQWVHFWFYLLCIILAGAIAVGATVLALPTGGLTYLALIIPVILWLVRWWVTKCTTYELTSQRLRIRSGVLNRRVDELELYRVKDYAMEQPLLLRMVGLGNLTLADSDTRAIRLSTPYFSSPLVFSVPRRYRGALLTPGQRVAAVVADTPAIAEHACRLITVEYEPLPAVFDPEQARTPGAPLLHADKSTDARIADPQRNLVAELHGEVGDVDTAVAGAHAGQLQHGQGHRVGRGDEGHVDVAAELNLRVGDVAVPGVRQTLRRPARAPD